MTASEQLDRYAEIMDLAAEQAAEMVTDAIGLDAYALEDGAHGLEMVRLHPNQLDGLGCSSPEEAIATLIDSGYDIGGGND